MGKVWITIIIVLTIIFILAAILVYRYYSKNKSSRNQSPEKMEMR